MRVSHGGFFVDKILLLDEASACVIYFGRGFYVSEIFLFVNDIAVEGMIGILRPSVYKDAIIYSAPEGKVDGGSITALFDYLDGNPAATELEADITAVDIVGNIAYAKVESDNWHGARYTDMFLLVKEGGEWKILTKVFHTHSK